MKHCAKCWATDRRAGVAASTPPALMRQRRCDWPKRSHRIFAACVGPSAAACWRGAERGLGFPALAICDGLAVASSEQFATPPPPPPVSKCNDPPGACRSGAFRRGDRTDPLCPQPAAAGDHGASAAGARGRMRSAHRERASGARGNEDQDTARDRAAISPAHRATRSVRPRGASSKRVFQTAQR